MAIINFDCFTESQGREMIESQARERESSSFEIPCPEKRRIAKARYFGVAGFTRGAVRYLTVRCFGSLSVRNSLGVETAYGDADVTFTINRYNGRCDYVVNSYTDGGTTGTSFASMMSRVGYGYNALGGSTILVETGTWNPISLSEGGTYSVTGQALVVYASTNSLPSVDFSTVVNSYTYTGRAHQTAGDGSSVVFDFNVDMSDPWYPSDLIAQMNDIFLSTPEFDSFADNKTSTTNYNWAGSAFTEFKAGIDYIGTAWDDAVSAQQNPSLSTSYSNSNPGGASVCSVTSIITNSTFTSAIDSYVAPKTQVRRFYVELDAKLVSTRQDNSTECQNATQYVLSDGRNGYEFGLAVEETILPTYKKVELTIGVACA